MSKKKPNRRQASRKQEQQRRLRAKRRERGCRVARPEVDLESPGADPFESQPVVSRATEPTLGFDYGVLPRVTAFANTDFLTFWKRAECQAIVYGIEERRSNGILTTGPAAGLVFVNASPMRNLFTLMRSWMTPPSSEAAVDVFFVIDKATTQYFVCMSVNTTELALRIYGPGADKDYVVLAVAGTIVKPFPLSEAFESFRTIAEGRELFLYPIVLPGGAVKEKMLPDELWRHATPHRDLGFVKTGVAFSLRSQIATGSKEAILEHILENKPPGPVGSFLDRPLPSPEAVAHRRQAQLRRFFPVAIARLKQNDSFRIVSSRFCQRFADWQILQAACSLLAKAASRTADGECVTDMVTIYDSLRHVSQSSLDTSISDHVFDEDGIVRQVTLDMQYLQTYLFPESQCSPEDILREKGYI